MAHNEIVEFIPIMQHSGVARIFQPGGGGGGGAKQGSEATVRGEGAHGIGRFFFLMKIRVTQFAFLHIKLLWGRLCVVHGIDHSLTIPLFSFFFNSPINGGGGGRPPCAPLSYASDATFD